MKKKKVIIISVTISVLVVMALVGGLGFAIDPLVEKAPNVAVDGIKPFSSQSSINCNYYRIPALVTAKNGDLISAMDARFGGTHDSPNDIDVAVSLSSDNGQKWTEPSMVAPFNDFAYEKAIYQANGALKINDSASTIDPSLLVDQDNGKVFMLVDAFPYGTGFPNVKNEPNYEVVNGNKYLKLKKKGESKYSYTVRENGIIYDKNGAKTDYSLNEKYEVLQNGKSLTVKQKEPFYWYGIAFSKNTNKDIPMSIFFKDSIFQPVKTSYLFLLSSDDNGKTWSSPQILDMQVKPNNVGFFGVCPGRGLQISNGTNKGRLIFPVYTTNGGSKSNLQFATIYSDDHGATWKSGKVTELKNDVDTMSETQLIELPDGSVKAYARTVNSCVASAISKDGGVTFENPQLEQQLPLTKGSGCMVSVINYNGKIDGKDAIILSAPAGNSRKNGFIYIGLIDDSSAQGTYSIKWTYKTEITNKDTYFAYSCLTTLPNGDIGILYEQANTPQTVDTTIYKTFKISDLTKTKM